MAPVESSNIQWGPSQSKLCSPMHGSPEQVIPNGVHKDQQGTLLEHGAPFTWNPPLKALKPKPRIDILSGVEPVNKSKDAGRVSPNATAQMHPSFFIEGLAQRSLSIIPVLV